MYDLASMTWIIAIKLHLIVFDNQDMSDGESSEGKIRAATLPNEEKVDADEVQGDVILGFNKPDTQLY